MPRRHLLWILGLELFAIVWAGAVFSLIPDRVVAGFVAGGYFVLSGFAMLWHLTRLKRWGRRWTTVPLLAHLFGISLPLLITRWIHRGQPFDQVHVWGLEGPTFHRLSTQIFGALIAATVIDLVLEARRTGGRRPALQTSNEKI